MKGAEAHQQNVKPELLMVTFGKGFGVSGAAVLCSDPWPTICCSLPDT
jgi:7-keto-8-aminopelargonate synthetase-like enzyme